MTDKTGSEVLKHDDVASLGRGFEGIGESRFLNCCRNPLSAIYSSLNIYPKED